jgi:hypothetical protein
MFNRIFGKNPTPDQSTEAPDTRGLEVTEDDPETAWSMWDNALAQQGSPLAGLPPIPGTTPNIQAPGAQSPVAVVETYPYLEVPTQPLGLEQATPVQQMKMALDIVELHHHRIANTIRTLWGYKECGLYINKLIMNGGDGMDHSHVGFNPEAADAMMVLADLHDAEFGSLNGGAPAGFLDSLNTGISGHR